MEVDDALTREQWDMLSEGTPQRQVFFVSEGYGDGWLAGKDAAVVKSRGIVTVTA